MLESRRKREPQLSGRDKLVLDLERKWGTGPEGQSHKLREAAEELGLDRAGYTLVLRALLEDPIAHAYDPATVESLRAVRDASGAGDRLPFGHSHAPRTY